MPPASHHIALRDWGLMVLLSIVWGGSYLFIGIAVKELAPLVIIMARVVIAAAVLLPLHFILQVPFPKGREAWTAILGLSVLNNVIPFTLIVTGQTMIASGLASVINATSPLFGVAFAAAAGLAPLQWRKVLGIVIGVSGVAVLKGGTVFGQGAQSLGILLCLAAAASYGLGSTWTAMRLKGIPPLAAATGQLLCSSVLTTALAFTFSEPSQLLHTSAESWIAVLGLALLATSFAYLVFFKVVERAGAQNVLLVTMMIPVSAILMGYAVLNERLEAREIIGALIIIVALLIIDGRVLRLLRPRDQAA
jgi:drug/metabolite transporter (DMT)-like permease